MSKEIHQAFGQHRPPDGEIRRSQVLTLTGSGSLVDLPKDAVIIGSLENWKYANSEDGIIESPRLAAKALSMLRGTGKWKFKSVRLRLPPTYYDDPSPNRGITAGQFPTWFLCQNGSCRSLVHISELRDKNNKRRIIGHKCRISQQKTFPVVPVRFISGCLKGHIQDINWPSFIHRGVHEEGTQGNEFCRRRPKSGKPYDELEDDWESPYHIMSVRNTGDIADLIAGCRRCGAKRGLQDLANLQKTTTCSGWRPWIGMGKDYNEDCEEKARLLIRTASNSYFPHTVSALTLPDQSLKIKDIVQSLWHILQNAQDINTLKVYLTISQVQVSLQNYENKLEIVLDEIKRRQTNTIEEDKPIREEEWSALINVQTPDMKNDLPSIHSDFEARWLDIDVPKFIRKIVLVHSLKECRAQIGFSRFEFPNISAEGESDLINSTSEMTLLSEKVDWIPTIEVKGEGIFIAFDEEELRKWEANPAVQEIEEHFRKAMKQYNQQFEKNAEFHGSRLIMLHSLAHMLITIISFECGYSAAAIRERIYCHKATEKEDSRAGILLYTGTPGSEGTLGGLVEVGRNILAHMQKIPKYFGLCSNDPICAQHQPNYQISERFQEGAACHACLLIAEPSCERMNRDLDRTLVVPTVENQHAAFLANWLN